MSEGKRGRAPADAPPPVPYAHPLAVAALEEDGAAFALAPSEEERAALAGFLGVNGLPALGFAGRVEPAGEGWAVRGTLTARVAQTCVVSLDPMESAVEAEVERVFLPGITLPESTEIELDADADRAPEPLGAEIDLGAILAEALALGIDPYPRKEGEAHGAQIYAPPGLAPLTDEAAHPFASLAALKDKLSGGGR
ncbi:MAG: DUF177 domain-containing protein [Pseudomonadota bacterium]